MKATKSRSGLPAAVRAALAKLGSDLSLARRRRRLTIALVAERAFVGRNTITRVERGDPGVSIGIYATVLFIYGMTERLAELADVRFDAIGLGLEHENLPKRIRSR